MPRSSNTALDSNHVNVSRNERSLSLAVGALLLFYALIRLPLKGVLAMFAAVYVLFFRGIRGYCFLYEVLGINTAVEKSAGRPKGARTVVSEPGSPHFTEAD